MFSFINFTIISILLTTWLFVFTSCTSNYISDEGGCFSVTINFIAVIVNGIGELNFLQNEQKEVERYAALRDVIYNLHYLDVAPFSCIPFVCIKNPAKSQFCELVQYSLHVELLSLVLREPEQIAARNGPSSSDYKRIMKISLLLKPNARSLVFGCKGEPLEQREVVWNCRLSISLGSNNNIWGLWRKLQYFKWSLTVIQSSLSIEKYRQTAWRRIMRQSSNFYFRFTLADAFCNLLWKFYLL